VLALALAVTRLPAEEAPAAEVDWHTGAALQRALRSSVGLTWSETELRPALLQLSRVQRVAMFLDRRVDPNQLVAYQAAEAPLDDVLRRLATRLNLGVARLGPVLYLGPATTATVLDVAAEQRRAEASRLPAAARKRYLAVQPLRWEALSEPRQLLEDLARSSQIEIAGLDGIPHDLWPGVSLPPLTLVERLSLVLAGFEQTFRFEDDGRRICLEPLDHDMLVERAYRHSLDKTELQQLVQQLPDSRVRLLRGQIVFRGTAAEHQRLQRLLRTDEPAEAAGGIDPNTVYTLTINNQPVGAVIRTLEQRGLEFQIDPSLVEILYTRVSFEVREATLDRLLAAALEPAGLTFSRQGSHVTIRRGE
jgi:hypothetical protein